MKKPAGVAKPKAKGKAKAKAKNKSVKKGPTSQKRT